MTRSKRKLAQALALSFLGMQVLSGCVPMTGGAGGMLASMPEINGQSQLNKCSSSGVISNAVNIQDLKGTHLEVAFQYLVGRGMTKQGAAAIVASIYVESAGGYPWMAEVGYPFDGSRGWGIVQWTGPLHRQIRDAVISELGEKYYTSQYSNPPANEWMTPEDESKLMQFQLNYLWEQLNTPEYKSRVFDPIYSAKSAGEAGRLFVTGFERPADTAGEAVRRAALAEEYYQKMKNLGGKDSGGLVETAGDKDSKELKWAYPFDGKATMTSPFGRRPYIQGVAGSNWHSGIDLVPEGNKDVRSISSGTVIRAAFDNMSGNLVVIKLDNGDITRMAHLASMDVKKGDRVEAGQKVGVMGGTGSASTGAHLHFETLTGADITNPDDWGTNDPSQNRTNPVDYLASKGFNVDGTENGNAPSDSIVKTTTGGGKSLNGNCSGSLNGTTSGGGVVAAGKNMHPRSNLPAFDPKELEGQKIVNRHDNETDYVARVGNYLTEKHGGDLGITKATDYASAPPSCHATGEALDLWANSEENFDTTAAWIIKNADALNVSIVIWKQQIWINNSTQNKWTLMEDRGSPTQNHMDHIHVSFKPCWN